MVSFRLAHFGANQRKTHHMHSTYLSSKVKHRRGFQSLIGLEGPPVLAFTINPPSRDYFKSHDCLPHLKRGAMWWPDFRLRASGDFPIVKSLPLLLFLRMHLVDLHQLCLRMRRHRFVMRKLNRVTTVTASE